MFFGPFKYSLILAFYIFSGFHAKKILVRTFNDEGKAKTELVIRILFIKSYSILLFVT